MGILDDFITDMTAEKEEEAEVEVKEQEKKQGGFDSDYSKSFLDYCKNNSR